LLQPEDFDMKKLALTLALAAALAGTAFTAPAHAQRDTMASELSALSALPVAVSVVAPAVLLSTGAVFTVVAVEATSRGTVLVLERASVGARASLTLSGALVGGASLVVGASVVAVTLSGRAQDARGFSTQPLQASLSSTASAVLPTNQRSRRPRDTAPMTTIPASRSFAAARISRAGLPTLRCARAAGSA
jgi:hypothetical protein